MGKPSIFSKDYEKKMRRRRGIIILSIFAVILLTSGAWLLGKVKVKSFVSSKKENIEDKKKVVENKKDEKSAVTEGNNKEKISKGTKKTDGYEIKLSSGEKIKLIYEEENNVKKFKYIYPLDSKVKYDISPSNKKAIVYDEKIQKIISVDINGKILDITNPKYVSTDGSVVINHDEQIQARPDYIWCDMPKFVDENNIAYVSQLPWLNKTTKYIWIYNIPNNTHMNIQSISGEELTIDKLSDKGLKILADGKTLFLKANGDVTE